MSLAGMLPKNSSENSSESEVLRCKARVLGQEKGAAMHPVRGGL